MTNWPDKPLIRVIRGRDADRPEDGVIAIRSNNTGTYRGLGCSFTQEYPMDSIDEWEEVAAVPTAALEELKKAWHGDGEYTPTGFKTLGDAVGPILSYLPVDKPSALDRAIIEVKGVKGSVLYLADFDQEGRLALLLGCLATLQAADHKTPVLAMVARICVEWVNLLNPGGDALSEVKACVESAPDGISFIVMSSLAGDVAAALGDGMSDGPITPLLAVAQYALAWMTGLIEEGER